MGLDYSMLLDFVIEYHWTMVLSLTKQRGNEDEKRKKNNRKD